MEELKKIKLICFKYKNKMNKCAGCPLREGYGINRKENLGKCLKDIDISNWNVEKYSKILYNYTL